ncbi:MAG: type II secretion system F family protein [Chloroflexota bacterium]
MPTTLLIIGIIAFLMVVGAGMALLAEGRRGVDQRLEQYVSATTYEIPEELAEVVVEPDVAERFDSLMSRRGFFQPIRERISRSDVKLRVSEYLALTLISALLVAVFFYFFLNRNFPLAILGFLLGLRIPRAYLGYAATRRINAFGDQLSDTLNLWVNALRSGYSVLQSMETIATELPPPVSKEFERVVQEVRLGLSLEQALDNMLGRVPSEDLDLVVTAVKIQREVGGNLSEILDNISFTIRERVRIKGEIRTLTAQGRISGWVVGLLPLALMFILLGINPSYISELWVWEQPIVFLPCGWYLLGIGAIMTIAGVFFIRKIVDIEV